jgi:eukaryotic-like serine/threonine-protein kinase
MSDPVTIERTQVVGRYALHSEIASGGMAVVYFGKLLGPVGFSRPVAIKRLHKSLARDPALRDGFIDEARLASRIRHPNVVQMLDVVDQNDELLLVMEYVHGESLHELLRAARRRGERVPLRVALAIIAGVLHGLHAAHEATSEAGAPLNIVHRDVSPQNVLVGVDGVPRVLDFGIARAAVRTLQNTGEGIIKGKLAYMAPEQLGGVPVDRRADIFSASVLLWEMLAGRRLFVRDEDSRVMVEKLLRGTIEAPSVHAPAVPKLLDAITLHGLTRNPEQRFETAREMALAIERFGDTARPTEVAEWVEGLAIDAIAGRKDKLKDLEMASGFRVVPTPRALVAPPPVEVAWTGDAEGVDESALPTRVLGETRSSMPSPHSVSIVPMPPVAAGTTGARLLPPGPRPFFVFGAYALLGASIALAIFTLRRDPESADVAAATSVPATARGAAVGGATVPPSPLPSAPIKYPDAGPALRRR